MVSPVKIDVASEKIEPLSRILTHAEEVSAMNKIESAPKMPDLTEADVQLLDSILDDENFEKSLDEGAQFKGFPSCSSAKDMIPINAAMITAEFDTAKKSGIKAHQSSLSFETEVESQSLHPNRIKPHVSFTSSTPQFARKAIPHNLSTSSLNTSSSSINRDTTQVSLNNEHSSNSAPVQNMVSLNDKGPSDSSGQRQSLKSSEEKPLNKILMATPDGQRVLIYYKTKAKLNSNKRNLLCNLLIRAELKDDPKRKLQANDFHRLTQLICDVFPSENPLTYYVPFSPKTPHRRRQLSSGKLWHKYHNFCKSLRQDGVRQSSIQTKSETAPVLCPYDMGK